MKTIWVMYLLVFVSMFLFFGTGCEDNDDVTICNKIIGKWVEEEPLLYDGISDTIVFTENNKVEKHFLFNGWRYEVEECKTVMFTKNEDRIEKNIEFISDDRLMFYNFIDRSITNEIKNIAFKKMN
ncbi:hypothetical protein [Labilibaculum euxinus]|uniref:Lipocalin-like domain-containing protein n=1 Tax=Labilibaculum euxinus TaxID=2686357 RepID=A0A7M4D2A9_9BACT|nr:hypothetical protein [Labilibaculum euxinus]MUP36788.1 hypothetical protein [Labilibaculum euxinus]MVB05993.1 hypothetical protein [Labilibaculum euxinus]